jgi:cholera toxin transcriptional activator
MTDERPLRRYRFGTFEADAATGELRRSGIRLKLNAQPFQVLCLFLERPGELLSREDISRALWPEGTFVDYEHGVNSAVNRIRDVLGDTAANPRFIETLSRRGYRFVAPVEKMGAAQAPLGTHPAEPPQSAALEVEEQSEDGVGTLLAAPHELPKVPHHVALTLFVLLQLMYLSFYVGALANLSEIEELLSALPASDLILNVLIVTAGALIPVRAFVISAAFFRAPRAREKYMKLWPILLALDVVWALSPFLLLHHINFGLALACTALLVYSPFAQRALVLMGAYKSGGQVKIVS